MKIITFLIFVGNLHSFAYRDKKDSISGTKAAAFLQRRNQAMSIRLGKIFKLNAVGLMTALVGMTATPSFAQGDAVRTADAEAGNQKAVATLVNNPVARYTGTEEIPTLSRPEAFRASTGQIFIHYNERHTGRAMAFHDVLEELGYPTTIADGRDDLAEPFEVFIDESIMARYSLREADMRLTNQAVMIFDYKIRNIPLKIASIAQDPTSSI